MPMWIQKSLKKHKPGALHRMLGVPKGEKIPTTWLRVIDATEIDHYARNPTQIGKRTIKVTHLVKERAVLALTLRGFRK